MPAPGRGLQGDHGRQRSGKAGAVRARSAATRVAGSLAAPLSGAPSLASDPALRFAAAMCAARMPALAHIFRGTFVHSTWTCPMEVLRDHLLGVSDSGKVSGRGAGAPRRAGGQMERIRRSALRSPEFAQR